MYKSICDNSDYIFDNLLSKESTDSSITVDSVLSDIKSKDILEKPLT